MLALANNNLTKKSDVQFLKNYHLAGFNDDCV